MDPDTFKNSVNEDTPPGGLSVPLLALWHVAKGNWDTAHQLARSANDKDGAWVHAHLHRVEGNDSNAAYWFARTDQDTSGLSLDEEWGAIVETLLLKQA